LLSPPLVKEKFKNLAPQVKAALSRAFTRAKLSCQNFGYALQRKFKKRPTDISLPPSAEAQAAGAKRLSFDFTKLKESTLRFRRKIRESKYWEQLLNLKVERVPPLDELFRKSSLLLLPLLLLAGLLTADLVLQGSIFMFFQDSARPNRQQIPTAPKLFLKNKDAYQEIVDRNLFCPGCPVPDMEIIAKKRPKDCDKARPLSGGFNLIGTIVLSNADYSVATVTDSQQTYALKRGDRLGNFGEVFEIRRTRVCVSNRDGLLFYLELPSEDAPSSNAVFGSMANSSPSGASSLRDSPGIKVKGDHEVEIDRKFVLQKLNDPNILYEAYATPYTEDGQIRGFRIQSINPGSTFEKIGFKPGDIIVEVDGKPMDSLAKAQELYATAGTTSELNITVLRDGNRVNKNFTVK
jgi:type II secretion system protein C